MASEIRRRRQPVCFTQQVIDLWLARFDAIKVAVEGEICGSDQTQSVPWNDKERPTVLARFDVERALGRSGKSIDHNVTAFSPSDLAIDGAAGMRENFVDPRS